MNYKQSYLNLSDLFTLYYKGTDTLRQGVVAPAGPPICNQRWVIFSEFFGFLYSNGNYQPPNPWMPDHPTAWENIKEDYDANSNPTGRSYDTRFMGFAEFWYTRLGNYFLWFIPEIGEELVHNKVITESEILRFNNSNFNNTGLSEVDWIKQQMKTLFETYFLENFLKSKVN